MVRRLFAVSVLCMLLPLSAFAQEGDTDDVAFDQYSAVSEQLLLLKGTVQTTLPDPFIERFYDEHGFGRFKRTIAESDPNTKAVQDWCMLVVEGTQMRREQMSENGEDVEITQRAVQERCSDVYKFDASINHQCGRVTDDKGKPYLKCVLSSAVTFYKFKAVANVGTISWESDKSFAKGGQATISMSKSTKVALDAETTVEKATVMALNTLVKNVGMFAKRKMLDVKQFQLHAPIISAKKGKAMSCLGRDTVELDLPFIVMFNSDGKEVRKGFVKARKIYDGCVETLELKQAAAKGQKVELVPMESQIILGGKKVKPGYTMWEMPSIGLNFGGALGFGQSMAGFGSGSLRMWPTLNILLEQSIAAKTKVSELHTWETVRLSYVAGEDFVKDFNSSMESSMPTVSGLIPSSSHVFVLQIDAGVVKRWYSRFFFFGLGAGINFSYNISMADITGDYMPTAMGVGANGLIELGFQLTPRFILDFKLGYRFEAALAMLLQDGEIVGDVSYMGIYHGPSASINLLYNF